MDPVDCRFLRIPTWGWSQSQGLLYEPSLATPAGVLPNPTSTKGTEGSYPKILRPYSEGTPKGSSRLSRI